MASRSLFWRYSDLLALPTIKGTKSEEEKFAGSVHSRSLEAFVPVTGKGIQAATCHYLGQNFAKMRLVIKAFEDVYLLYVHIYFTRVHIYIYSRF